MKTKGFTKCIDALGRFTLPSEIRKELDIKTGDYFDISVEQGSIIITPCDADSGEKIYKGILEKLDNKLKRSKNKQAEDLRAFIIENKEKFTDVK